MTNKTQAPVKSKPAEASLAEYMEKLGRISGEKKTAGILRWMGVSSSSYSNWVRRGTIPYKTLVNVLLERNISLNWFFAPYSRLQVPVITSEQTQEKAQTYRGQLQQAKENSAGFMQAYADCESLLQRYGVAQTTANMQILLDMHLRVNEGVVNREDVLEHLAQTLLNIQNGQAQSR
ncbi:helix-turn-helix domain-containing protein [Aliidiomarina maris]|uniref:Bacteriophage CI repressor-like protein n=1 Tax=Aliidiomarina maris TaxID=531312 RepID=A0A327WXH2_9GAMM|nr:helix-turn-helix domain-containing protein [Aliidiomarina maris]MBA3989026.1 hypothetical protein [Idiomarina sp.]MCL5049403.1 helix-turn-helix domain containing protein [Bacillota bacterium]RAJ96849.1 bacteriophage CI repressor-like protein [Aliidiomarina maris]RUO24211.1 hypothetical protein CWE07_08985 [Aliidiomarina maris]